MEHASALFTIAGRYEIILTVTDGSQQSRYSRWVEVSGSPAISFSVDKSTICLPQSVRFTAQTADPGVTIDKWHWDFGDGNTIETTQPVVRHQYTHSRMASVSVTATTSEGCSQSVLLPDLITIHDSLLSRYSASPLVVCSPAQPIQFTNESYGVGNLSYLWDFGDGQTSTQVSPLHQFQSEGQFTPRLIAQNDIGCSDTFQLPEPVLVGNLMADFSVPPALCTNTLLEFRNISSPGSSSFQWFVDGVDWTSTVAPDGILRLQFADAGTHRIRLINNRDGCIWETEKELTLSSKPSLDGFLVDIQPACTAPWPVQFTDTSSVAVQWAWNFTYWGYEQPAMSTERAPFYNFNYDGDYRVQLRITDQSGCTAEAIKPVTLRRIRPQIVALDTMGRSYCEILTKHFAVESPVPVVGFDWDFDDGTRSSEASPIHDFKARGDYSVKLYYTLANGCTGMVEYPSISVYHPARADFEVQPEVCGNNFVHFNFTGAGSAFGFTWWDFGDSSPLTTTGTHKYQKAGTYSVTLMITGLCGDTITKENIITVKGPFIRIDSITNTCEGDRREVTIHDGSTDVERWNWDLGDGTTLSYTDYRPVIKHRYENAGTYSIKLSTENGSCTVPLYQDSLAFVLPKNNPILSFESDTICINQPTQFNIHGLETSILWLSDLGPRYYLEKWENKNGAPFEGQQSTDQTWYTDLVGQMVVPAPRNDSLRMIIRSKFFDCLDTSNYVLLVANGVNPGFRMQEPNCFKSPVLLTDTSRSYTGQPINLRYWDFGDGSSVESVPGETISHVYQKPGTYSIRLQVDDGTSCSLSSTASATITVKGVAPAFTMYPEAQANPNQTVQFSNTTSELYAAGTVRYLWYFGDGQSSTDRSSSHGYSQPGTYEAMLIAIDEATGCSDTVRKTLTVVPVTPQLTILSQNTYIGQAGFCPPLKSSFSFTINDGVVYDSISWDFGDAVSLPDNPQPTHIYTAAGEYVVTLRLYFQGSLIVSANETIKIVSPAAQLLLTKTEVCPGGTVQFYSNVPDQKGQYTWDLGDGIIRASSDSFLVYQFTSPGSYYPSLLVTDENGCSVASAASNPVIVHNNPVISTSSNKTIVCKQEPVQLEATGAVVYIWSPATGLSDPTIANPVASPSVPTSYEVTGTDINGCQSTSSIALHVPSPFTMPAMAPINLCVGETAQLNASGAHHYTWINQVEGLSNTEIPNPIASPLSSVRYLVVGYDEYNCYTDSNDVLVTVHPLPILDAGPDLELVAGAAETLSITGTSDIVRWQWTPGTYLSCNNCPNPVATPLSDITYIVKGTTAANCTATDTIGIKVICRDGNIHIPSAFTPNNDGLNDRFGIAGQGVNKIVDFRIYNRWGEVVFLATNFTPGSTSGQWNGRFRNMDAPAGTYIYVVKMECQPGQVFERKGTVTLLR